MLRDGENLRPVRLAVPARDAGEAVGDVGDFDVERGGVDQIEPAAREHALPGAPAPVGAAHHGRFAASAAQAAWRWQSTRWSLTMPTACMKA